MSAKSMPQPRRRSARRSAGLPPAAGCPEGLPGGIGTNPEPDGRKKFPDGGSPRPEFAGHRPIRFIDRPGWHPTTGRPPRPKGIKTGISPPATGKYPGKCCSSERIFLLLLSGACPPAPRYRLAARLPHHTDLAVFHLATPYKDKAYAYCEEYYLLVCHSERHLPARRRKCRLPGRYQGRRQNHLQPLSRKSDFEPRKGHGICRNVPLGNGLFRRRAAPGRHERPTRRLVRIRQVPVLPCRPLEKPIPENLRNPAGPLPYGPDPIQTRAGIHQSRAIPQYAQTCLLGLELLRRDARYEQPDRVLQHPGGRLFRLPAV